MAEVIEMPFGKLTHVGPRNRVLHGVKVGRIHFPSARGDKMAMRPFIKLFDHLLSVP